MEFGFTYGCDVDIVGLKEELKFGFFTRDRFGIPC